MREHNHQRSNNRRRGPKYPLPNSPTYTNNYVAAVETPYYTIDNTEDIYGTTLSAAERCYIDPWDLENYDYVRRRLDSSSTPSSYYSISLPSSPIDDDFSSKIQHDAALRDCDHHVTPNCEFCPCCDSSYYRDNIYGLVSNSPQLDAKLANDKDDLYGYGFPAGKIPPSLFPNGGNALQNFEFPSPPPQSLYDYCSSYGTCKPGECYDCSSMIYAGHDEGVSSLYDESGYMLDYMFGCNSSSTLKTNRNCSTSSSLGGSGIYSHRFGLSKKGLLQIDYSCSWDDLDRAIGRNY